MLTRVANCNLTPPLDGLLQLQWEVGLWVRWRCPVLDIVEGGNVLWKRGQCWIRFLDPTAWYGLFWSWLFLTSLTFQLGHIELELFQLTAVKAGQLDMH